MVGSHQISIRVRLKVEDNVNGLWFRLMLLTRAINTITFWNQLLNFSAGHVANVFNNIANIFYIILVKARVSFG